MRRARADDDPIRLVWTLFYVAICHAALRKPEGGQAAANEAVQVAETTGNPSARAMARYALGLVLKKSEPQRALASFDDAAELAASVQNFWWHGIALMEAAATRAVHADTATAATSIDRSARSLGPCRRLEPAVAEPALRDAVSVPCRALDDAHALHRALIGAGRPSPLSAAQIAAMGSRQTELLSGPQAVARARTALARYC